MSTILDEIVARKRADGLHLDVPSQRASAVLPFISRPFTLISEVKKASPSKGVFDPPRDPVKLATSYRDGGAHAISVLTESNYFRGSIDDLMNVKDATQCPVLRKDFLTEPFEIAESHRAGADAVLLIVAVLHDRLDDMLAAAREVGVTALTEVHSAAELESALQAGAKLIGINNRDLKTFHVDVETCFRLKREIPAEVDVIAESGLESVADIRRLVDAGFAGALIGEALVTDGNPQQKVASLVEAIGATA